MAFRQRSGIRQKKRFAVEEDQDDDAAAIEKLAASLSQAKVKKKEKTGTKFSFDDDEEEVVYVKKTKSKSSHSGAAGGGSYSKAALAELRQSTPSMPADFVKSSAKKSVQDGAPCLSCAAVTAALSIPTRIGRHPLSLACMYEESYVTAERQGSPTPWLCMCARHMPIRLAPNGIKSTRLCIIHPFIPATLTFRAVHQHHHAKHRPCSSSLECTHAYAGTKPLQQALVPV